MKAKVSFFISFMNVWIISESPCWSAPDPNTSRSYSEDVNDYVDFLASANQYSPLEGAGSHGSLGIGVAAGASQHRVPVNAALIDDQIRSRDEFQSKSGGKLSSMVTIPRVFAHKGLPWPIDLGASAARIPNTQATSAGGYAQWTLFESLALPALAVRGKYSRLMGLPSTEFQTATGEIVASFGFLRFFNLYGALALNRHVTSIQTQGTSGTTLTIADESQEVYTSTNYNQSRDLGIQIQVLPPFCTLSIETRTIAAQNAWIAKIGVGL
ncbi:MAG: hypothetical protein NTV34_04395 [Proteobacteria bacterium]|nr:hypothetical protein [Pseudomonadota bacterium]